MKSSLVKCVRIRGLFSSGFKRSVPSPSVSGPTKLTREEQEKLRSVLPGLRTDKPHPASYVQFPNYETDDVVSSQIDIDSIRARGFMRYRYSYVPPVNVAETVVAVAKEVLLNAGQDTSQINEFVFGSDNHLKAMVLLALSTRLKHCPMNSQLMHLKTVDDIIRFYTEPVENLTTYAKLARSEKKPANMHIIEQAVRFHPDDSDSWHSGITAFPGSGGTVFGQRNKRILRQFQPRRDWFDYEDQAFDYSPPDKDMPWDPEVAKRMDRYPNKRYNLSTKQFTKMK